MVERGPEKAGVGGPIPSLGINYLLLIQVIYTAAAFCAAAVLVSRQRGVRQLIKKEGL